MSYSMNSPCGNCKKQPKCTDHVKIRLAIDDIHKESMSSEAGHMGAGTIAIQCHRVDAKDK